MRKFVTGVDWKAWALPLFIVGIAIAGYYVGSTVAANVAATPGRTDALGERALNMGDKSYAFSIFRKLADKGDALAQYQLGMLYLRGVGTKRDPAQALSWFTKAAGNGNVDAARRLGRIYLGGEIAVQDFTKARHWLDRAANAGDGEAARLIGDMDAEGLGRPADKTSAYAWYEVAALRGDSYAEIKRNALLATLDPAQQKAGEVKAKALEKPGANTTTARPSTAPATATATSGS